MDYQVNDLMHIPEIDHDLLMELLDDTKEEESLGIMVDSLEEGSNCAEQSPIFSNAGALLNPDQIHTHEGCEDCSLDDMLSSLDGHECSVSLTNLADSLLDWVEMDADMDSPSSIIDDQWQLEGIGFNSLHDGTREYFEQDFCPLWE
jgi:dihydroxyacetone kinase